MGGSNVGGSSDKNGCSCTARQSQIVTLAAEGLPDKKIAMRLALSVATIRAHLQRFYRENGAQNRSAAVAIWIRNQASDRPQR